MLRKVLICIFGVAGLAFCWSCGTTTTTVNVNSANKAPASNAANAAKPANSSATTAPADRKVEITTTADALFKEYKADPKSMEKYKGKVVEISGKFSRNSGSEDALEVKFDTGDPSLEVGCRINASAVQAAAKFQKGQEIKMTGIGDPNSIIGPLFKDCQMAQ